MLQFILRRMTRTASDWKDNIYFKHGRAVDIDWDMGCLVVVECVHDWKRTKRKFGMNLCRYSKKFVSISVTINETHKGYCVALKNKYPGLGSH